ncbi:antitoxin [Flavobacterium akiainvivens]|uniref:Antitoxin n=1 Tax=Flavobacterium akiainvivens TaxID=1202724 RepID=A0A0M8M7V4_9FLAO|nr:type II toxin-antitoxin system ParD family antitoxin [Flavobacterium akiainvivens]KOS05253.1 antitoxin [Flavobacterium akiainvivens]SFQ50082.1 antitoxin ParD1/3/4 [Flavobacterium akiainvivens]
MAKNTSILLGNHFDDFISKEVASGRYNSASEVIRSALRLLELEEDKIKRLRNELEEGENSGFIDDFNPQKHLENLRKKHV